MYLDLMPLKHENLVQHSAPIVVVLFVCAVQDAVCYADAIVQVSYKFQKLQSCF